jgi:hypothetical protein
MSFFRHRRETREHTDPKPRESREPAFPTPRKSAPASDYAAFLERRRRAGKWFPVWTCDLQSGLTAREALVLSAIMNFGKVNAPGEPWVWLADSILRKALQMDPARQAAVLTSLSQKGIVSVQIRDGKRFVRVHLDALPEPA